MAREGIAEELEERRERAKALRHLPLASDAPDLVPARMLNEVVYCERLAYLEWAQGEFADNVYTVDGRLVHRRVDARPGALPSRDETEGEEAAEADDRPFTVRSLWLSSEELGITAKLDVVEGEGGEVVPIEHKRGSAPEHLRERVWLPERIQVCAHVLLLRAHGYASPRGEIYFARDRRRVAVPIDDWLIEQTLKAVARAREVTSSGTPPAPLENSPKCNGCSLHGICLPDEVTLLKGLADEPLDPAPKQLTFEFALEDEDEEGPDPWGLAPPGAPAPKPVRRLVPARDERLPLYVQAQGGRIGLDGDTLRIEVGGTKVPAVARVPLTSHVAIFGNVQISTQALAALLDRDIPIVFFSGGGWYRGRTIGHGSKNVELRVAQYRVAADPDAAVTLARAFVAAKIRNQRTLLRRNHAKPDPVVLGELEMLATKAERATAVPSLLGLEGTAARYYFGAFTGMLKGEAEELGFDMAGRNRRPPRDPVNALLSFAYSLLTKECVLAASVAGLDPLLGFLHQPRYGRPALALDMMEEMRPLVADSTVVTALNTGVVRPEDFVRSPAGCALTSHGRKRFIHAYERRMDHLVSHPLFGYRLSYRRLLELQARLLGRVLLGEIESYPAFRTR